jgi:hypothetical protein
MVKRRQRFTIYSGLLAILSIVSLAIDPSTRTVELPVQTKSLSRCYVSIKAGSSLAESDPRLLNPQTCDLATSQFAATYTISNALVLITFALVDPVRASKAYAAERQNCYYNKYRFPHAKKVPRVSNWAVTPAVSNKTERKIKRS